MANQLIKVRAKGKKSGESKVVLWERNEAHPGGEVYIREGDEATVALTPAVSSRLKSGLLTKVEDKQKPVKETAPEAAPVGNVMASPAPAVVSKPAAAGAKGNVGAKSKTGKPTGS